jgi:hypothetical protein
MRPLLACLLAVVSCFPNNDSGTREENRVVTTPGGSCGYWRETQGSWTIVVNATCGGGMSCAGTAYYASQPGDLGGRNFQTCLPPEAFNCGDQPQVCPETFACVVRWGLPPGGACIHTCTKHTDCPDSYQVCFSERCTVQPCGDNDGGGDCWDGTQEVSRNGR